MDESLQEDPPYKAGKDLLCDILLPALRTSVLDGSRERSSLSLLQVVLVPMARQFHRLAIFLVLW